MSYRQQGYVPQTQQATRRATQSQPARRTYASTPARSAPARKQAPQRKASTSRRPRRRRTHPILKFFSLALFALLATVCVMGYMMYDEVARIEKAGTFYPGVYIDNYELTGASPLQAYEFLLGKAQESLADWKIELKYGGQVWTINADTLGLNSALETIVRDEVNNAFHVGREQASFIDRYQTIAALKTQPYLAYTTGAEKNMSQIDGILEQIRASAYVEPVDAGISFDVTRTNNPRLITNEQPGRDVDLMALKEQVVGMIVSMEAGTIEVQTHSVTPSIVAADLQSNWALLGTFTTEIRSNSTPERNTNIQIGCQKLNGQKFKAGATISFNELTGLRTLENGYRYAQEIVNGEYVPGIGGGICQVSSTFYQAALHAGLKVKSRTCHARLPLYMEKGADATVADRGIDLKMINSTGGEIIIYAKTTKVKNKNYCEISIYGQKNPNGYTYKVTHETIETIPIPLEPVTKEDKDATHVTYTDQEKVTKGEEGYKVRSYQIVLDQNGNEIDRIDLGISTYKAVAPTRWIGITPRSTW